MKKTMMALTLALTAPAAFGAGMSAPVAARGQAWKAARSERTVLLGQRKAELAKIKAGPGTRAEKKAARQAVHRKYAALIQEARTKRQAERSRLREDMKGRKNQILRLRVTP